jgi:hypothetical protein
MATLENVLCRLPGSGRRQGFASRPVGSIAQPALVFDGGRSPVSISMRRVRDA